jgi:hypothetical protein
VVQLPLIHKEVVHVLLGILLLVFDIKIAFLLVIIDLIAMFLK